MIISDIIKKIQNFCPESSAEDWDNAGLQLGNVNNEATGIFITLDVNARAVSEAIKYGCNLIVSHHPMYFTPFRKIDLTSSSGMLTEKLIKNDITVYSAHTNMDKADGGINAVLSELFELKNPIPLTDSGLGKIGELSQQMTLKEFAAFVSEKLNAKVRYSGNPESVLRYCALCSGSGSEFIDDAVRQNADVFVTGDMKYHIALDAVDKGIAVIDAGHFGTEIIVLDIFENILKNSGVKIIKSTNIDCFIDV